MLNIAHQGGEDEFPSNTLYAFKRSIRAGADMLELDVGVTRDGQVIVMHDTTVNRTTNGRGTIASHTLKQLRKLDAAYWFAPGRADPYRHGLKRSAYRFRGVATGKRTAPRGFKRKDFRVPTLRDVLRAFPHTPINVEIKGRTKKEETAEYVRNAEALAKLLRGVHRRDIIVVSFRQQAVDRFHALVPDMALAPGIDGTAAWLLGGGSPGPGVVAFQLPITYQHGPADAPGDDGRERRPRAPRGLCLAHVAVRRRRVGRDLAAADRRVRRRGDDGAPGRVRADVARARRPRRLRLRAIPSRSPPARPRSCSTRSPARWIPRCASSTTG